MLKVSISRKIACSNYAGLFHRNPFIVKQNFRKLFQFFVEIMSG
jgi:hypothetical protein